MTDSDAHNLTSPPPRTKLGAWLQLLRVPNLLTVPGDPIAGFCLAWATVGQSGDPITRPYLRMSLAALISLLMYSAGLLFNDWFDLAEDLRDRPTRPLPSGLVRPNTVAVVAAVLLLLALFVAKVASAGADNVPIYVALALAVMILAYNGYLKRLPAVSPLAMALCRGLSVLVGGAAFGWVGLANPMVLAAAGLVAVYVAFVTNVARRETSGKPVGWTSYLMAILLGVILVGSLLAALLGGARGQDLNRLLFIQPALLWSIRCGRRLQTATSPSQVQRAIGECIGGLLLLQAMLVGIFSQCEVLPPPPEPFEPVGLVIAGGLYLLWPVFMLLARRFYSS